MSGRGLWIATVCGIALGGALAAWGIGRDWSAETAWLESAPDLLWAVFTSGGARNAVRERRMTDCYALWQRRWRGEYASEADMRLCEDDGFTNDWALGRSATE
jgi:hypothetical protein